MQPSQLRNFLETMVITMRGIVIMMKAQDSLQDLIFQNLKKGCMLMTSWIGFMRWNMSLSIVTPLSTKG